MRPPPLAAFASLAGLALGPLAAHAQKPAAPPSAASRPDLGRLRKALETGGEGEKLAALRELSAAAGPSAGPAAALVSELLVRGASVPVVTLGLEVQGKLAQPAASASMAAYVRHRTPEVRRAAARALASTGGPEAVAALRAALRGSDAALRRDAASGLRTLKAKDAVPDLFSVLGKDVPEAASAIGTLCGAPDCQRLADLLGKLPFDLMQSGLEPILLRPEAEVPEDLKLELLERLRRLQTGEASTFLKTVRARYPKEGSARVRAGLEAAVSGRPVKKPEP